MKKLLIALAAVLVTAASYAQGQINFNNRNSSAGVDAPVTVGTGGPGPGPSYSAGLWYNGALIPGSITTFRDGTSNPLLAKYINGITVTVPGTAPGQSIQVEMRAWLTSEGTYDTATTRGNSSLLTIASLGGDTDPTRNNNLPSSFTGFVVVPEPSTLALGVLGAAALLLRRRK